MKKFGDIINVDVPVLIFFFADWHTPSEQMTPLLRELSIVMGEKAKIIKIDVTKNKELAVALNIDSLPTFMLYFNKEIVWREEGIKDEKTLFYILKKYSI